MNFDIFSSNRICSSDSFRISQEHGKQLEEKLNASEKARKEAEAKLRDAEGLQAKLGAAEKALKEAQDKAAAMQDRIDQIDAREADLIKKFDVQSEKFGGIFLLSTNLLEPIFCFYLSGADRPFVLQQIGSGRSTQRILKIYKIPSLNPGPCWS